MRRSSALDLVLILIGAHSLLLGICLLAAPRFVLGLVRWPDPGSIFFPTQCGLFLVILGAFYVAGKWHRPFAWIVIGSKGAAVIFLAVTGASGSAPAIVGWQAIVDGAMGAVVLVLLRRESG